MHHRVHKILPKKTLSQLFGYISRREHPLKVKYLIKMYMFFTGASLEDAKRKNIGDYDSLNDFFTRELEEGVRPIGEGVVSPVDGRVAHSGSIQRDEIFAVKGHSYSLRDLVGEEYAEKYQNGHAMTLYLAPHDYHRIHAPEDCHLVRGQYIPGEVNSVSPKIVAQVSWLFARNERVVYEMQGEKYTFLMVLVGAVNVSSIETLAHGIIRTGDTYELEWSDTTYQKGDEIGRFNLGSTVILIYPPQTIDIQKSPQTYRMGETIGTSL